MALNAFLSLKGQKQGDIKGSVTQKGQEGKILVFAADHEVLSPRDLATGQSSGKRQHRPFVITKELDRSSPLLYNMLITNETCKEWELQFWAPGAAATGAGKAVQQYTVRLTNAAISDIRFHMRDNKDPVLTKYPEYEEVTFVYQSIQWTWVDGAITAQDDWGGTSVIMESIIAPSTIDRALG